ncbi:S-layer homology domain-containing protein [Wukongibacter baidiensis]|uniref:S-layer homology domain-containing protein n=1 Tax=Wukongibacter baidiensis TaxID=1723361 RepID=UPI003D7FC491
MNFKKKILLYFIAASVFVTSSSMNIYAANATTNNTVANAQDANAANTQSANPELDKRINSSINKLMAFGIVEGKDDGQYHPEDQLTREEFTKIMIEVLGMGDAVDAAPKDLVFRDIIIASRWAVGYINLAASQGIINGGGDGLFRPRDKVTLAQAVTIILRSIGYREEFLSGEWPNNYILKATELGLLDGIKMDKNDPINRGIAALLINNAMEIDVIKSYPDGRGFYVTDTTLLEDKQNLYKLEKIEIREKDIINKDIKVSIEFTKDTYYKNDKYKKGDREEFLLRNEFSSEFYVGIEADIYIDEDDRILYIDYDDIDGYGNTVFVNEIITNGYDEKPSGKIKLSGRDEYVEISKSSDIYVDGEDISDGDYEEYLDENVFGTFIVEDDELSYANLLSWEEMNLYVKSVDTSKKILNIVDTSDGNEREIEAEDLHDDHKVYLIEADKKTEITFADIVVGDVINISEEQENKEVYIYVWRNSAQGRVSRLAGGNFGQRIFFFFSGDQTKNYFSDNFSYSYNNGKNVSREKDETVVAVNKLSEFYNEQVTVYKNWRNEVVYIQGNFNTKSDLYGIFRNYISEAEGKIQIFTKTGSITTYAFEEIEEYGRMKANNIPVGSIIKYSIGKSSKLKNLSDNIEDDIIKVEEGKDVIKAGDDFGEDYVIIDGTKISVDSNTAYFDYTSKNAYSLKYLKWNKFKNKQVLEDVDVIAEVEDGVLKVLAIWDNMEGIQEDPIAGYALNQYRLGSKNYVEVDNAVYPSPLQFQIDDDYDDLLLNGRVVLYGVTSDNKLKLVEDEEIEFISGQVESGEKNKIYIDGEKYRISDETQVFRGYEEVSSSHLKKSDLVALYVEDGVILVAEILDSEDATSFEEGTLKDIDSDGFTIEIDGEDEEFSKSIEIDYIFKNGYLEVSDKSKDITEVLEEKLGNDEPTIKFMYDKETDEIYSMWIDDYK